MTMHPYSAPRYVNEGDSAFIPWPTPEKPRQGLRVTISVAAGKHCRIVNEAFEVDRWIAIDRLMVPNDDPRAEEYDRTTARRGPDRRST